MPDGPAASPPLGTNADADADADPPPVDGLAKGLPGLPVNLQKAFVDEDGFHFLQKELDVPWDKVTRIHASGSAGLVEYRGTGGLTTAFTSVSGRPEEWEAVEAAWREHVMRRIERDGVLRGTIRSRLNVHPFLYVSGPLLVSAGAALGWWGWGRASASLAPLVAPLSTAGLLLVDGMLVTLLTALAFRSWPARRARWTGWELKKEGLACHSKDGAKRLLVVSRGDTVTPSGALLGGTAVPFPLLTTTSVLARLVLAMGGRAGAACRPASRKRQAVLLGATANLLLLFVLFGIACVVFFGWHWSLSVPAAGVALTLRLPVVTYRRWRRRLGVYASDGRAMLERLGW